MESFYIILVVVLFALAISDLIVGVSNDAVNFLNSAIGSKAAPKWLIFIMASAGVLVGATFSSGMMEVARKGIFHPDMFFFSEIMIIFMAVMITDVILLDLFNTFGMPTSTTVSIVFELLGSAVAVSIIKIKTLGHELSTLSSYINSDKALMIITGILLSVVIAFSVGAIVQYISRLAFSFNYKKSLKYYGSILGGLSITAITYFMLIKGMKGSSFASMPIGEGDMMLKEWVTANTFMILFYCFLGWTVVMEVLKSIFKVNILKLIVMVGTFALAMAFAGNDLVNFIGVPLAGFKSFQAWASSGGVAPDAFSMAMLKGKVGTPTYMLLISGLVMIVTLILSRKARAVVDTEVNLGRQDEADERFGSSYFSRLLVRNAIGFNKRLRKIIPTAVTNSVEKRFAPVVETTDDDNSEKPAFDLIRAACNLVVASILISIGTSLKLPLSTTYVTFMVAMGTSLADRAWDSESAVYRISGVMSVIGGWFLTAFVAFSASGIIAATISLSGNYMIFGFVALAIFMVIRTHAIFNKRKAEKESDDEELDEKSFNTQKVLEKSQKNALSAFINASKAFNIGFTGLLSENRAQVKEAMVYIKEFNKKSKKQKTNLYKTLQKLQQDSIDSGLFHVQVIDYMREMAHSVNFIVRPIFEHVENQHKPFIESQVVALTQFVNQVDEFFNHGLHILKDDKFGELDELVNKQTELFEMLKMLEKTQIKLLKKQEVNTRNSQLLFSITAETKNLLLQAVNLIKSQRDFVEQTNEEN